MCFTGEGRGERIGVLLVGTDVDGKMATANPAGRDDVGAYARDRVLN